MDSNLKENIFDDVIVKSRNRRSSWVTPGYALHDKFSRFWPEVVLCIAVAEMFFPFLLYTSLFIYEFTFVSTRLLTPSWFFGMLFASVIFGSGIFLLMLVLGNFASLFIGFCCKTLGIDHENHPVATFVGGLAGLLLASPFILGNDEINSWVVAAILSTTILGQIGAYRGARRAFLYHGIDVFKDDLSISTLRFGLKQVMILTAWLAVVLTVLKLLGLLTLHIVDCLAVWGVTQFSCLAICILVSHRFHNKVKRSRST